MKRSLIALSIVAGTALAATPALAGGTRHTHYCNCGHTSGSSTCGSSSSSSTTSSSTGGTTTSSGGTTTSSTSSSTGGTTTSGGTSTSSGGTSSSGGTAVPEPGVLGMMGLSLAALGFARSRQRRQAA